jgi:hypothetical protein
VLRSQPSSLVFHLLKELVRNSESQAPPNQTLLGQGPEFAFEQTPWVALRCTKLGTSALEIVTWTGGWLKQGENRISNSQRIGSLYPLTPSLPLPNYTAPRPWDCCSP